MTNAKEAADRLVDSLHAADDASAVARLGLRTLPQLAFGMVAQNPAQSLLELFRSHLVRVTELRSQRSPSLSPAASAEIFSEFLSIVGVAEALSAEAASNAANAAAMAASVGASQRASSEVVEVARLGSGPIDFRLAA